MTDRGRFVIRNEYSQALNPDDNLVAAGSNRRRRVQRRENRFVPRRYTYPIPNQSDAPMAESYSRIQSRIAQLQRQADGMRRSEMAGVIKKIKVAIDAYGITSQDLFGAGGDSAPTAPIRRAKSSDEAARYSDGAGNIWGGRGPRPKWLRDAIAGGKSLEEFAADSVAPAPKPSVPAAGAPATKNKGKSGKGIAIKYRDGDNTWTGRGSQPRWLRSALSEGKTLEQFRV